MRLGSRNMQSETAGNGVEGKELDEDYQSSLDRFTDAVEKAIVSSHAGTGLDAGERRFWGSVLFTRLCTISVSILWLSPRSKVNAAGKHWDFGSVASMARNLFECALQFYYLGVDSVSDDEWYARLKVMQCTIAWSVAVCSAHSTRTIRNWPGLSSRPMNSRSRFRRILISCSCLN